MNREYRVGLRTQPWGTLESDGRGAVVAKPGVLGFVSEKVLNPMKGKGSQAQCLQFVDQFDWVDGVECRTVIHEQHPEVP